jgi:hypothetical protein
MKERGSLSALTIWDGRPNGPLAADLPELLDALAPELSAHTVLVTGLDCTGAGVQDLCDWVEAARQRNRRGLLMGFDDFRRAAAGIEQTIDGALYAAPTAAELESMSVDQPFATSRSVVGIRIIDGGQAEVVTRNARIPPLLRRRFRDVRDEDPANYL